MAELPPLLRTLLEHLRDHDPILAGTFPLGVDIESSDLDVICSVPAAKFGEFQAKLRSLFGDRAEFRQRHGQTLEPSVITNFRDDGFEFEIFAQDKPTREQNAVRHLQIEARLLEFAHADAREAIRTLKRSGLKTEPAFAQLFEIEGDPYEALLALADAGDDVVSAIAKRFRPSAAL